MTIDARRSRVCLALSFLLACASGCAGGHEERRGDSVDVSSYPPEIQAAYRVFSLRCSRCHTLARPLNARIHDPQHWIRYVRRMRRMPGSGIDHSNGDLILSFLLYYHRPPDTAETPTPAAQPHTAQTPPPPSAAPAAQPSAPPAAQPSVPQGDHP